MIILAAALPAMADLKFVPTLTVSERYDSNILFTSSGQGNSDFVTSVSPGLSATYRGRPLTATLSGNVGFSSYAKNTNLNYISTFGRANVDLTQLVGLLDKRARLQIAEYVQYTPELPAFVSDALGVNPFEGGLQAQRARSFTSITSVTGGYALTPHVDILAAYSYTYLDFGNTVGAAPETTQFKTIFQTLNAGPDITLTSTDTLNLKYRYQRADYEGDVPGFQTHGGTVGLTRRFSPQLTGSAAAGMSLITPSDRVMPLLNLSASWRSERKTTATIFFSHGVTPSFLVAAGALTTTLFGASLSQELTGSLQGSVSVNYAHSTSVAGTSGALGTSGAASGLAFDSLGASMALSYRLNRSLQTTFTYSHTDFKRESLNLPSNFDRDLVMVSLTASWR